MTSVTAIVVAYDSAGVLPACLAALKREGVRAIVIDNASEDDSVAIAQEFGAHVIRNAKNEGFGRANNAGVAAAETEFCLILNPDIVLDDGAVAALTAAAERYPDAALYAPRIVEDDGRFFYQNRSLLRESVVRGEAGGDPRGHLPEGDACAPFLSGACLLVRRADFLDIGGFDPEIFLFYEDDDLCRRFADAGRALLHVHDAVARHGRGKSTAAKPGRRYKARWHLGWSRVYIARKYGLPDGAGATLRANALKAFLSRLLRRQNDSERYGGLVDGTRAALRGDRALDKEGLT